MNDEPEKVPWHFADDPKLEGLENSVSNKDQIEALEEKNKILDLHIERQKNILNSLSRYVERLEERFLKIELFIYNRFGETELNDNPRQVSKVSNPLVSEVSFPEDDIASSFANRYDISEFIDTGSKIAVFLPEIAKSPANVLAIMLENAGKFVSAELFMATLKISSSNALKVHIHRLRNELISKKVDVTIITGTKSYGISKRDARILTELIEAAEL